MKQIYWLSLILFAIVEAKWQTVFNSNYTIAYLQSVNGSLYKLPISNTDTTQAEVNQNMKKIASAPKNSSLVLDKDNHLLAVWGSNGCGSSPIEISQYNPDSNQWATLAQSDVKSNLFYQDSQIVWLDRTDDTIYIYGGACNGDTQSGFYSYSLTQNKFSTVSSKGVMPREMAEAQAIALSDYETLIIGGRADGAWMSMQQVAIWGHGSWAFNSVANSTGIDSRDNPLLLPVWKYGQNGSFGTLSEILVIGGTVAGRKAQPSIVKLKNSEKSGWYWSADNSSSSDLDVDYAGSTLYSTLVNIDSESNKASLYGDSVNSQWEPVSTAVVVHSALQNSSTTSNKKDSKSTSTAVIAVVSTLLPIIVLCLVGGAFWWLWRRREERRLFLKPNRMGMLRRQPSTASTTRSWNNWMPSAANAELSSSALPVIPYEADTGSIMMMDSADGNQLYMSRHRRSLRVVNPDGASISSNESVISNEKQVNSNQPRSRNDSAHESRKSSWTSTTATNPFSDAAEQKSEFDFSIE